VPHASRGENLGQVQVTAPTTSAPWLDDLHPKHWIRRFPTLSPYMTVLMDKGDVELRYGSTDRSSSKTAKSNHRHAATAAAAAGCARFGWNGGQFVEANLDCPSAVGRHARRMMHLKGREHAIGYLDRVWERAVEHVGTRTMIASRQDSVFDLIALRDKIGQAVWRGTAGSTALRVLMAFWETGSKVGGRIFALSYRDAAEQAGCTARTAYLAVKRRLEGVWVRLLESGKGEEASTWMLLDGTGSQQRPTFMGAQPKGGTQSVSSVRNGELDAAVVAHLMSLDAFAHRGLGASSLKILAALRLQDCQTVKDLIESAMLSQSTVYRKLSCLSEHGLVVKNGEVWELTETAYEALAGAWEGWDTVAAEIGTYGTAWRRQQRHKDERAVYHGMVLPRFRERRAADVIPIRGDEVEPDWVADGCAIDPVTGEIIEDLVVASDGRFLLVVDELDYDELLRRNALACAA
jgi:DNA-binding transcriptional ArsR family regulator